MSQMSDDRAAPTLRGQPVAGCSRRRKSLRGGCAHPTKRSRWVGLELAHRIHHSPLLMKTRFALLVFVLSGWSTAVESTLPSFPPQTIGVPPLSLADAAKQSPLAVMKDAGAWFRRQAPSVRPEPRRVAAMPVIAPRDDLDSRMVHAPDPSVDHKLIVRVPDVAGAAGK